jgi:transposase
MLLNNRRFLQDKRIATDNEIRGSLRTFGLKVGPVPRSKYEARVRELVGDNEKLRLCILPMLEARRVLVEQCMTIPGVGPLTALAFKTYVDRPQRFQKSKAVGASLGLTPRKYASGGGGL